MPKHFLKLLCFIIVGVSTLSSCSTTPSFFSGGTPSIQSTEAPPSLDSLAENSPLWQKDSMTIWNRLQHTPPQTLQSIRSANPTIAGWIKLALISKTNSNNTAELVKQLQAWRAENPSHPGNSIFPNNSSLTRLYNIQPPQHVALLLPLQGHFGKQGKMVRDGFLNAYYSNSARTHITQAISFYDTSQTQNIYALYQKALSEGADFIVGPLTKEEVQTFISQGSFSRPTLALNYTDIWLGSLPANFYEFGLSPIDEAQQVADKAREDGHSRAIIIASQTDWGKRVVGTLSSRWQADGGSIQDTLYVSPQENVNQVVSQLFHFNPNMKKDITQQQNGQNLAQQGRRDFDVIFLLTPPQQARQIVPLIKYYYVNKVAIYSTSIIYSGSPSAQDVDLNGVIFADTPWTVFSSGGQSVSRLYAVGRDAYTLSHELPRMLELPNFPIYGATGALTLNSQHQIYRRLPWTTIRDGHT